jgi:MFS family permease
MFSTGTKVSLSLLTLSQGIFLTNNVCLITINGLVGLALAPQVWMATFPIMAYVLGGALTAPLVGWMQKQLGRKKAFLLGAVVAFLSALGCAIALYFASFIALCLAILIAGYYNASAQLYRFAAAEIAPLSWREKAISWVLAGGLLGAILGPSLAVWTKTSLITPFLGSYIALAGLGLLSALILLPIDFKEKKVKVHLRLKDTGRPLLQIMRHPIFIVATLCASLGYGVMGLLMSATPIVMQMYGHAFDHIAWVVKWHVIGMFAPGFFTGILIKHFGNKLVLLMGLLAYVLCITLALNGLEIHHFLWALTLLGVGWNFLFTASTHLLLECYEEIIEKDQTQSAHNTIVLIAQVFAVLALVSLVDIQSWYLLNAVSLVLTITMLLGILYLLIKPKQKNLYT